MKTAFATIFAIVATVVSGQVNIISVTSPLMGATYTAGEPAKISWINAKVDVISKIVLAKGDPNALTIISTIAENVDANAGTYTWNIPSDTEAGDNYAFEFGTSPDLSFTGLFTIKAASKNETVAESSSSTTPATSTSTKSSTASIATTTTTVTTTVKSGESSTSDTSSSTATASSTSSSSSAVVSSSASSSVAVVSSAPSITSAMASTIISSSVPATASLPIAPAGSAAKSAAPSVASSEAVSASPVPTAAADQRAADSAGVKMTSNKAGLGIIAIAGVAAAVMI